MSGFAAHRAWERGGERPVLALHCSLAHAGAWGKLAAEMSGITLTAIDQPGHGRAPDWDGQDDLHGLYTQQAAQMAAHLGKGQPIDIFGHSWGATVALRLAIERPDLVRSLMLIEPSLFAAAKGSAAFDSFAQGHLPFLHLLSQGQVGEAAGLFHSHWGAGEAFSDLPTQLQDYILARLPLLAAQNPYLVEDRAGLLRSGQIEAISVPVLLVRGSESPAVAEAILQSLADRLPRVASHQVQGAQHMVPITHAAEMAAAVQAHLDGC